jgi:hypothetical protein
MKESYEYKGFQVMTTARQISSAPYEAWGPLYRIDGSDLSQTWTPRDRNVVFATEMTAIKEAGKRAEWLSDNSPPTPIGSK